MKKKSALAVFVLALCSAGRAFAQPAAFRVEIAVVDILNLDTRTETASLVTNILGAGLELPFANAKTGAPAFAFEPKAGVYWGYYEYSNKTKDSTYNPDNPRRAVPTEIADRDAFVIGLLLDTPVTLSFQLSGKVRLAFGLGLGFNLRWGFKAANEVVDADVAAINEYFWSNGRFLLPSSLLRLEYKLTERFDFGFEAKGYWPLFNLWTEEGIPFLDQGIFGGSLVIRYSLK